MRKLGIIVALLAMLTAINAQAQQMVPLAGNRPASLGTLSINASSTMPLSIEVRLSLRNQAQLSQFLNEVQNPSSPSYHKFLTPEQFTARFGPSQANLNAVVDWLTGQGFKVTSASLQSRVVTAAGNAGVATHAFGTNFLTDGASLYANTSDPLIPAALASSISYIGGLDNLHALGVHGLRPPLKTSPAQVRRSLIFSPELAEFVDSETLSTQSPAQPQHAGPMGNAFGPQDLYKFYNETPLIKAGNTGTSSPDCIALPEFSDVLDAAVTQFDTTFSLPSVSLSRAGGPSPGIVSGFEDEALLDIEWSHAVSSSTPVRIYFGNTGADALTSSIQNAVNDKVCGVISSSIFECFSGPNPTYFKNLDTIFAQAASQGQSVMIASGDNGAAGDVFDAAKNACVAGTTRNVGEEAASPNVTGVGGTQFPALYDGSGNDLSVQGVGVDGTEVAWNNNPNFGATGGGASSVFSKPAYQTGSGVPADGKRDVPDVALGASANLPGFYISNDVKGTPTLQIFGSTSISAPMWAGLTRLIGKTVGGTPPGRLGNINIRVYQMANTNYAGSGLFDIVTGNNTFNGVTGYDAGPGFDLCTGWGSPNFANFAAAFVATPTPTATPTATPTPIAGGSITVTSVANIGGSPGQTVAAGSFMLNNTSSGAESVSSVTLTVSDPNLYSSLALTATVSGTPHTVTVSPPTSSTVFTFSPALSVPAGGSASFSLSAMISTTPAMLERRRFEYATILDWPGAGGLGSLETGLGLLALVLMIVLPAVRRRTLILLALLMVLAASETGCGSNSSATVSLPTATATPKPSSSQTVTSVSATASGGGTVTFTGLPASLGKVSLQ